ncbi:MAG: hypothetical protein WCL04_04045 [Verrucomicrobiota bacterium]
MNLRSAIACILLLVSCGLFLAGADAPAPAKKILLPTFTIKEGYRDTLLQADTLREISPTEFDATGVEFTKYKRNAANDVDIELVTPAANVQTDRKILRGDSTVHVVSASQGIEISGEQWSYDQNSNTVVIEKNTRVVLRASLPDLLK